MKVCYFGIYRPEYSRNKILISGLRLNGAVVIECRTDKRGVAKYFDLAKKHWQIRKDYDVMVVGFSGFQCAILAKFLTRKPIVFDAFLSMYDSIVLDRKQVASKSLRAKYLWWLDKISMSLADVVLFDTNEHIKYVINEFSIPAKKLKRIFLGANTDLFFPRKKNERRDGILKVLFFGTFIPLQGVEYVIKAAKIIRDRTDIIFEIAGSGLDKEKNIKLVKELGITNVFFTDTKQPELVYTIADADICLGIFGDSEKTARVIPNKVFESVAMRKPVITADTLAIRELFDSSEMMLVKSSSSESLAKAILELGSNRDVLNIMAENGYKKFVKKTSINQLGAQLLDIIEDAK